MYPPTSLGAIKFTIRIKRTARGKNKGGKQNDRLVKDIRMES
jgi:hypothetical protein